MVCVLLGNAARGRIKVRGYTECISHEFLLLKALLMIVFAHVHVFINRGTFITCDN